MPRKGTCLSFYSLVAYIKGKKPETAVMRFQSTISLNFG